MLEAPIPPTPIRSPKDPLFWLGEFREFAEHVTGKRDMRSLYARCAAEGAGMERLIVDEGERSAYRVILDGHRKEALFFGYDDATVIARMRDGKVVADDRALGRALQKLVASLPPSQALEWHGGARRPTSKSPGTSRKPSGTSLTGAAEHELTTAAEAEALTDVELAQLKAAVSELSGKKTLPALWAWLKETDQSVVLLRFSEGKTPRYDGWLLGALEDGVFFEHGKKKPMGIAISQGEVADMTKARRDDVVAALQAAMKKVRLPRRNR